MSTFLHPSKAHHLALAFLFTGVLAACGGGDSASAPAPTPGPPPAASARWVSSAAQIDLAGGADSGIDGPLRIVDPAQPDKQAAPSPGTVDSTSVRIMGGTLDSTLSTLDKPGPSFVVYDVAATPAAPGAYSLYKLALDGVGTAAPVPERISTEASICSASGTRFNVLGQSLSGDEALITYQAPDATGSCATGGVPKLVKLSMGRDAAPIALPTAAAERLTPIGVIHGSSGQVAALLAWRNGGYVHTDASMGNAVALASADVSGTVDASATPTSAGIVTRYGIFIKSADGLRRYDKATGKVSAVLLTGQVGSGAQVNEFQDDQALYITTAAATSGAIDLYRVSDTLLPTVIKLNTEGALHPWGFRVLKSYLLYAVDGRDDFVAWRKADGQRSNVLANKRVVMSSTLYDRVFHTTTDLTGGTTLASSAVDGSDERSLGAALWASGALASQTVPFARSIRGDGAFAHAVVVVPASGKSGLTAGNVRWVSFDTAAQDIDAGNLPAALDLGATLQAPGIIGEAGLLSIAQPGGASSYLFVSQRTAGSLTRAN
ncbi:MAG: hypothetical protein ABI605_02755 [Rhizobacter sp.]